MGPDDTESNRRLDTPTGESCAALLLDAMATVAMARGVNAARVRELVEGALLGATGHEQVQPRPPAIDTTWEQL